jgi:phosphatidylglycerophosphate synthase
MRTAWIRIVFLYPEAVDMANAITLARLLLLFVLVAMMYFAPPAWQLLDLPLLIAVVLFDWLDGVVARRRNECRSTSSCAAI